MLDQQTRPDTEPSPSPSPSPGSSPSAGHGPASTRTWLDLIARALRRGQPTPTRSRAPVRYERRFFGYLALTIALATMVLMASAAEAHVADSTWFRMLAAVAISAAAALAMLAAAASAGDRAGAPRRERRTRC